MQRNCRFPKGEAEKEKELMTASPALERCEVQYTEKATHQTQTKMLNKQP